MHTDAAPLGSSSAAVGVHRWPSVSICGLSADMRGTLTSDSFAAPAEAAEFFEFAEARGWGDGLPLIPPTEARVQTLLETVDEAPETVIGVVEPRRGEATTE